MSAHFIHHLITIYSDELILSLSSSFFVLEFVSGVKLKMENLLAALEPFSHSIVNAIAYCPMWCGNVAKYRRWRQRTCTGWWDDGAKERQKNVHKQIPNYRKRRKIFLSQKSSYATVPVVAVVAVTIPPAQERKANEKAKGTRKHHSKYQ